jgi:Inner membrane protein CreD
MLRLCHVSPKELRVSQWRGSMVIEDTPTSGISKLSRAVGSPTSVKLLLVVRPASKLRATVLCLLLVVLYGLLYVILNSGDYAIRIGSGVPFATLVGTMYFTRKFDWYGVRELPATRRERRLRRVIRSPHRSILSVDIRARSR